MIFGKIQQKSQKEKKEGEIEEEGGGEDEKRSWGKKGKKKEGKVDNKRGIFRKILLLELDYRV